METRRELLDLVRAARAHLEALADSGVEQLPGRLPSVAAKATPRTRGPVESAPLLVPVAPAPAPSSAPPPREGGPMQCRSGGGALTVQPNALGANCDYCGADNLVNLPASWLAKLQGGVKYLADTVHEAAAEDQKVRADTRRQLLRQLGLLAAIIFLPLLGFGKLLDNDTANLWPPPLTTEIIEKKSRSGLLGTRDYKPTSTALYAQQDIPLGPEIVGGATWPLTYQNSECHLHRGETSVPQALYHSHAKG